MGSCSSVHSTNLPIRTNLAVPTKVLKVSARGRAVHIGDFYCDVKEELIPTHSFWSRETLARHKKVTEREHFRYEVVAGRSQGERMASTTASGNVNVDVGGLVTGSASGNYEPSSTSSESADTVTLRATLDTAVEALTMEHLGDPQHPDAVRQTDATHFVSEVTYAVEANLTFHMTASKSSDSNQKGASLKAIVEKIPKVTAEGEVSLSLSEEEKRMAEQITCSFSGDIVPPSIPKTITDVIQIFPELPSMLKNNKGKAAAVDVKLMAVQHVDRESRVHDINPRVILLTNKLCKVLQSLRDECARLVNGSSTVKYIDSIKQELNTFEDNVLAFQRTINDLHLDVRMGRAEEGKLSQLVKDDLSSPFNTDTLRKWIEQRRAECDALEAFTSEPARLSFVTDRAAMIARLRKKEHTLCFSLLRPDARPLLQNMETWLASEDREQCGPPAGQFQRLDISPKFVAKAKAFMAFKAENWKKTEFVVLEEKTADHNLDGKVRYLHGDVERDDDFQLPCPPLDLQPGNCTNNSIALEWSTPKEGCRNITHFIIEYQEKGKSKWKSIKAEEGWAEVTDLQAGTEYTFVAYSVCDPGRVKGSEASAETKKSIYHNVVDAVVDGGKKFVSTLGWTGAKLKSILN